MADIFQPENETYEIDVPKEKRYLNQRLREIEQNATSSPKNTLTKA